jgi:hypothetical protein
VTWDSCIRRARRLARKGYDRATAWSAGAMLALMCVHGGTAMAAGVAAGANPDLDALMALLAKRKHGEARYVEKDYLKVLDRPLKSSGVLIYRAPDLLEKRTLAPRKESLVLDGRELTVRRGDRTYHLDLGSYPQVAPYVDAIRATMAGDLGALERVFEVRFSGSLAHWTLGLVPLQKRVARSMRRIRIEGDEADVRSVQIDKTNGDRSVMTLQPPSPQGPSGKAASGKGSRDR